MKQRSESTFPKLPLQIHLSTPASSAPENSDTATESKDNDKTINIQGYTKLFLLLIIYHPDAIR